MRICTLRVRDDTTGKGSPVRLFHPWVSHHTKYVDPAVNQYTAFTRSLFKPRWFTTRQYV